jgi:spermidine/putrescine transport system permease protein
VAGAPGLTGATREAAGPAPAAATTTPGPGRLARLRGAGLILPGAGWLVLFFVVPLVFIFVVSLGSRDALDRVTLADPSLDNYLRAFEPRFIPTFLNSIRFATITTILSLAIGYPIAYWISRYGGRHKVLLIILVMLPFWTSYLIRTYSWIILLRDNGVVNSLLQAVGLTHEPIILMNTDISVILGMTYGFLPFAILPLFVSIDRLDPTLVAAGRDLYASGRQAFLHVTLPLTMPGIIAAALLTFIPALGDFVTPDLLGGPSTTTIAKNIQELFLAGRDWPYGAALGFVLMIVTLGGTLLALRTLRREVVGGD